MSEEQKQPKLPQNSKWKTFFSKKWTFPVLYMGAAALILASIMWYQDSGDYSLDKEDLAPEISIGETETDTPEAVNATTPTEGPDAVPVGNEKVTMIWPAAEEAEVDVVMNFYEEDAEEDVKAAALIQYEDSYWPHTGIDLATKDGQSFDVIAALDGKVTKAEKDPMVGFVIELEHDNGLTTIYQSVEDVKVTVGDEVVQGDILAKAGRNLFEKDLGVHLHFEVREKGESVSPEQYLSQATQEAQ